MQPLKPSKPSKLEYFQLSREFNKKWLIYGKYRIFLWYLEKYWKIRNLRKFNTKLINLKNNEDNTSLNEKWSK